MSDDMRYVPPAAYGFASDDDCAGGSSFLYGPGSYEPSGPRRSATMPSIRYSTIVTQTSKTRTSPCLRRSEQSSEETLI
ncbi:hypothetical protein TKK_0014357 [Trichogramma kaykai]